MPYKVYRLQNVSGLSDEHPDIVVQEGDPQWDKILATWKNGESPTDSLLWKKGVFALTKEVIIPRATIRQMVWRLIRCVFNPSTY